MHVVARVGGPKRKRATASYWASELNSFNTGFYFVNGTCGGSAFTLGATGKKRWERAQLRRSDTHFGRYGVLSSVWRSMNRLE